MQNLPIMTMLYCKAHLCEPWKNFFLWKVIKSSCLLFLLMLLFNLLLYVASISVIHDYAELSLLCLINLSKSHNIRMVKDFKNFCFSECLLSLLFTHRLNVNLLDYGQWFVWLAFDEVCRSERSDSKVGDLLVRLILLSGCFFINHFEDIILI